MPWVIFGIEPPLNPPTTAYVSGSVRKTGEGKGGGCGLLLGAICLVGKYMWDDEEKSRSDQRKRGEIGEKDLDLI